MPSTEEQKFMDEELRPAYTALRAVHAQLTAAEQRWNQIPHPPADGNIFDNGRPDDLLIQFSNQQYLDGVSHAFTIRDAMDDVTINRFPVTGL